MLTLVWRIVVLDRLERMTKICISLPSPPELSEECNRKASLFEVSMIIGASETRPEIRFFARKGNNDYLRQGGKISAEEIAKKAAILLDDWIC